MYFHYPAEYYDEDYAYGVPRQGDINFYLQHARHQGSPILELGCGTGRILIPIAQEGIQIFGLDMNQEMLAICDSKIQSLGLKNAHLMRASMDNFEYDHRFAQIYIAFRSFQHLLDTESQLRCLNLVQEHLKDDGIFIMDVFAPNLDKIAVFSHKKGEWEKEFSRKNQQTESTITRYYQGRADLANQTVDVVMKWEERDSSGKLVGRKEGEFKIRYIFKNELEHLLHRCGFDPVFYGHFDERPYDYVSGEIVAVCRKRRT